MLSALISPHPFHCHSSALCTFHYVTLASSLPSLELDTVLPQDLCTCCFLHLEYSSPWRAWFPPSPPSGLCPKSTLQQSLDQPISLSLLYFSPQQFSPSDIIYWLCLLSVFPWLYINSIKSGIFLFCSQLYSQHLKQLNNIALNTYLLNACICYLLLHYKLPPNLAT